MFSSVVVLYAVVYALAIQFNSIITMICYYTRVGAKKVHTTQFGVGSSEEKIINEF